MQASVVYDSIFVLSIYPFASCTLSTLLCSDIPWPTSIQKLRRIRSRCIHATDNANGSKLLLGFTPEHVPSSGSLHFSSGTIGCNRDISRGLQSLNEHETLDCTSISGYSDASESQIAVSGRSRHTEDRTGSNCRQCLSCVPFFHFPDLILSNPSIRLICTI